jgi:cytochrome c oxidase assembly protein subunit 15
VVRAAVILVGVELAQGLVGIVQTVTHLPVVLVGLHMAGACAVWLATLAVVAHTRLSRQVTAAKAMESLQDLEEAPAVR